MPYPCNCLLGGSVPQVKPLNEGYHVRRTREIPGVGVASLRSVSEERGVPKVQNGFPVPHPRVSRGRNNAENTIWGKVVASPEFGPW